jgi:aminoglycoside phosphotransferase (APT) family kinase protein
VTDPQPRLLPLLDYLAATGPTIAGHFREWQIEPVTGGRNNLLYRVRNQNGDYAVKFTIRDDRDRAGSEYRALLALQKAGLDVAPQPVLLEQARYRQPVVVQTWIEGAKIGVAPSSDADWHALIQHFVAIHAITPDKTAIGLGAAVLTMDSAASALQQIDRQLVHLPRLERSTALQSLVDRVERASFPSWPQPEMALCRGDPNPQNFFRRSTGLASVDWEYGGWGDPAWDLADLMSHPAYLDVPPSRLSALVDRYCPSDHDRGFAIRVQVYHRLLLVWWAARFARLLYEDGRVTDERLTPRAPSWRTEAENNYREYLRRATAELD